MSEVNLRRLFLKKCFSSAFRLTLVPVILESCGSNNTETKKEIRPKFQGDPCADFSQISEEDLKKRQSLGYVQKAASPDRQCGNCNLWLPPADEKGCGLCQLFKGPVPSIAVCTYWAPKV
ncbi:MAG: hypothetical protein ABI416_00550 [Ginsengibacter sp.]